MTVFMLKYGWDAMGFYSTLPVLEFQNVAFRIADVNDLQAARPGDIKGYQSTDITSAPLMDLCTFGRDIGHFKGEMGKAGFIQRLGVFRATGFKPASSRVALRGVLSCPWAGHGRCARGKRA